MSLCRYVSLKARNRPIWWACSRGNPWSSTWVGLHVKVVRVRLAIHAFSISARAPPVQHALWRSVLTAGIYMDTVSNDHQAIIFLSDSFSLSLLNQVEPTASKLNTNDVLVLKCPSGLFLWKGVAASEEEMAAAKHVCSFLGGQCHRNFRGQRAGWVSAFCKCSNVVIYAVKRHS